MILQKMLEGKKRVDDRERKKEELRQQRKDEVLKKMEQKRLENEIVNEMRKPVRKYTIYLTTLWHIFVIFFL